MRAIVFLLAFVTGLAFANEPLPAYSTYSTPPFATEQGGLAADVVAYLNGKLKGQYQFKLEVLPRERLKRVVLDEPAFKGVVLFLNPMFVADPDKSKFSWSANLLDDANVVLSSTAKKVEYAGPDSLKGMSFGAVLGHRYAGLDDRFGKDITRADVGDELTNLKKVAAGRIDVTLMAKSIFRYLARQNALEDKVHVSGQNHANFTRHIFAAKGEAKLIAAIDGVLAAAKNDPEWQALLKKYHLD